MCTLEVQIPPDAPLGEYEFSLTATGVQRIVDGAVDAESSETYETDLAPGKIIILCNPWSEDDQVCTFYVWSLLEMF